MTEQTRSRWLIICDIIVGKTHEAIEAKDGMLAGDNPAFKFYSLVGT